jgi:hypothetical protein
MSWAENLFWFSLFAFAYLLSPVALVWGWTEWIYRRSAPSTPSSKLSFLGFLLATSSALLGLAVILIAMGGVFQNYDHMRLFYRSILIGAVLSVLGCLFAIAGAWKSHSLRWQAPLSAVGTLAFWLIATTWP